MTPRKIGGYINRQEIARAQQGLRQARECTRELIDSAPGPQRAAHLVAKVAISIATVMEALQEIESIAGRHDS